MITENTGGQKLPEEFKYMFLSGTVGELKELIELHVTKLTIIAGAMDRHAIKLAEMLEMFYELGRAREAKLLAEIPTDPAEQLKYLAELLVKAAEAGITMPEKPFSRHS